jgi:phage gpG-like protein
VWGPDVAVTALIGLPGGGRIYLSTDDDDALNSIQGQRLYLDDPQPLLNEWAKILRLDARRQFSEGGDPAWKELAPSTIAAKLIAGVPARTAKGNVPKRLLQGGQLSAGSKLIASGALRDSWSLKNDPQHIETTDKGEMTVAVGSSDPIAIIHQYGTKAYTIRPKSRGVLAFVGAGGKMIVTNKPINHPPIPARPVRITETARRQMIEATLRYIRGGLQNGQQND